jgi:hypothetical protein
MASDDKPAEGGDGASLLPPKIEKEPLDKSAGTRTVEPTGLVQVYLQPS